MVWDPILNDTDMFPLEECLTSQSFQDYNYMHMWKLLHKLNDIMKIKDVMVCYDIH